MVTVTLETLGAFLVGALRVLVLRAGFAVVDLEAVAVLGINALRVYPFIIQKKGLTKPLM